MYQALYRKWRPRTFDDVVGQPHITETLKNQIRTDRLSHAYLFIGTRGTGKTSCAKILAKAVNCEHPVDGNPCNTCKSCRGIDDGSILDVVELDAASNNGVDNVRALRDEAVFSPASVKKRVYIVDEVHMLSTSAFNALLKILEEPPAHLMFILATTELHKVPATILSRCQRHNFKRIGNQAIADRLTLVAGQENINLAPDAAALIARLAEGGMRDALSLLDQCSGRDVIDSTVVLDAMGLAGSGRTLELLRAIAAGDTESALLLFQQLWTDGKNPSALLGELAALQRDILMLQVAPKGGAALLSGSCAPEDLSVLARTMSPAVLSANLDIIQTAMGNMRFVPNPKYTAELCLVSLCEPKLNLSLPSLAGRLTKLEDALQSGAFAAAPAPVVPQPIPVPQPAPAPPVPAAPDLPPWDDLPPLEDLPPVPELPPMDDLPPWDDEPVPPAPPVPAPMPEPVAAPAAPASGDLWSRVVDALNTPQTIGTYNFIRNPALTSGVLRGDKLTVYSIDSFGLDYIKQSSNQEQLRRAASEICGYPVTVDFVEGSAPAENGEAPSPLQDLLKFGNVKFE